MAASGSSSGHLLLAIVLVVLVFFVPRLAFPSIARWLRRRRGGQMPEPIPPWSPIVIAAMVAGAVVAMSWDSDLGRPALGALLVSSLGVILAMWRMSRRRP